MLPSKEAALPRDLLPHTRTRRGLIRDHTGELVEEEAGSQEQEVGEAEGFRRREAQVVLEILVMAEGSVSE